MERCHTDDLMPNIPISCLPPSRVDHKVQGLKVVINCPQPGSSWATYRPPPISRWSTCGGNDTVIMSDGPPQEWYEQGALRNAAGVTWPNPTLVSWRWCVTLYC